MVQQLETEREQSNQQYQNYVQHLNKEITAFSERNSKLTEENTRLAERERGLVEHVGELEKQLQQIIANQSKQSAVVEVRRRKIKIIHTFKVTYSCSNTTVIRKPFPKKKSSFERRNY